MSSTVSLEKLTDQALLYQFGDLVQRDCHHTASLLRHIDAIDRRRLWAKQGHPSMFDFLVSRHHMSESTAGKRIGAARTARRFPVLFEMVARGEIHLSGIHCLKAHLTDENHEQVLAQAKHKTIRQIEQLVAHLAPQPDVPSSLRALPNRAAVPPVLAAGPAVPASSLRTEPRTAAPASRRSPDPMPLAPGRYKLQVTLGEQARQKLKQLQDLLAHQIPNGDLAAIVERAFDALLTQVHKRKTGITAKPRASKRKTGAPRTLRSRNIPIVIRREVWTRDEGRCAFIGEDGHRCNETRGLEFAHLYPWAKGGADTAANIALRCQAHNALEAERDYGAGFMASRRKHEPLKARERVAKYVVRAGCNTFASGLVESEPAPLWRTPDKGLKPQRYANEEKRNHTDEFKRDAVKLMMNRGTRTVDEVAKRL